MSDTHVILAWPDTFVPLSKPAADVVSGLQSEFDRKRAEILDEAADHLETMARDNRALAQRLRERAGPSFSNENALP